MKNKKRVLSLILACCMTAVSIPTAFATENAEQEIYAEAERSAPKLPFWDVGENAWYYNSVKYVYEHNIMNGTSTEFFLPNEPMTRAMVVQILYNHADKPEVGKEQSGFVDVPQGKWYHQAVQWAYVHRYVSGVGNNRFNPDQNVTREEFAQILYNYAGKPNTSGSLSKFPDGKNVTWAKAAMVWVTDNKYMNGEKQSNGAILLNPKGKATRAQAATILRGYCQPELKIYRNLMSDLKRNGYFLQFAHIEDLNGDGSDDLMVIYNDDKFRLYEIKNGVATDVADFQFVCAAMFDGMEPLTGKTWAEVKTSPIYEYPEMVIAMDPDTKIIGFNDVVVSNWYERYSQLYYENGEWVINNFYCPDPNGMDGFGTERYHFYIDGVEVSQEEYENKRKVIHANLSEGLDDHLNDLLID